MLKTTFFPEIFTCVTHPHDVEVSRRDVTHGDAIFVSGMLMDPEFIRELAGRYIPFTAAVARNYARNERGRGKKKVLILEPRPSGIVLGVMLLKLTSADKQVLDTFERVAEGVRRKVSIPVIVGTCERKAITFLLNE